MKNKVELTRVNNDINGNPRYVVHFLEFLKDGEYSTIEEGFAIALEKAKTIGGKMYRGKDFGGGIVFQSYNTDELIKSIEEVR